MDEENFNVNAQDVVVNEEAEKETSRIDDFLSDLDYENSESDARIALQRLEIYNVQYKPVYDQYLSKIKDVINSFEDERARTIPVYQKELTLENREEAERIKAMPEYQELQQSCELYMDLSDTVQSDEIKKMPKLLKKMPENLRFLYFGQLQDFEQICKREMKFQKNIFKSVFLFVVCLAVLYVFSHYLDSLNWSWWGRFILSSIIMFILPEFILRYLLFLKIKDDIILLTKEYNEAKESDSLQKMASVLKKTASFTLCSIMYTLLRKVYWCAAIVIFMLPSWGDFSWLGWKTPITLAGIVALICVIVWSFMFYEARKVAKRYTTYMKDFEDFTSQYDEYRKFKKSAEGAKE